MSLKIKETSSYKAIRRLWEEKPLTLILFVAIFLRLVAVVFSKGWGMLDDHFLVVESAQSWVEGKDSDSWLPGSPDNTGPTGHSFFYPGIHFLIFSLFRLLHFDDPQLKMLVVRLLHAAWSLITVIYGFKIAARLGNEKVAKLTGLLLAAYWFMPWVSVRNMVEVVCIPLLMLAVWMAMRGREEKTGLRDFFLAGILLGLAFNIRIQTAVFSVGFGLVFLLQRRWKELIMLILGALLPVILIQGTIDYFIWGKPFVEITGYVKGNIIDATSYINSPWYNYFLTLMGVLLPPVSLFLFYGYLRNWRKLLVIFLPAALFFIFHSWFPNKQERFILPILPFVIISGMIGWDHFMESLSGGKHQHRKWMKAIRVSWIFFWIVNILFLLPITVTYSKKSRVETMTYLSKYENIKYLLVADEGNSLELFPKFYLNQWPSFYDEMKEGENRESFMVRISKMPYEKQPRFILFTAENNLKEMVVTARNSFPFIVYETTIEPGFIDKLVKWLNPVNKNRTVYIYRNTLFYKERIN